MAAVGCARGADRAVAAIALAGALTATGTAACVPALAASPSRARHAQALSSLRLSPALWATIDVCNPADQRYTVGIRGSMPGDGQAHDTMMMRFRLQYMDATLARWVDLASADSAFLPVGAARSARQAGRSFVLLPPGGRSAFTLRGVVSFQWRRGAKVLATLSRTTTSGHQSLAGADPANFSASTCRIS
jgi:hypothetical protein